MNKQNFDGLMVILASTQDIEKWSHGEVTHPETINYRTGKPKPKGLSCEAIFGPIKNYECSCGKYKGVRYKGIVCERCGVEVTSARVRRERMGHIDLAFPVLHVWYKSSPSGGVHQLLGLSSHDIEKILSFVKYVVVKPISEQQKEQMFVELEKNYTEKLKELDEIYAQELKDIESGSIKNAKKSDLDKVMEENKSTLEKEYSRIKGIMADLKLGSTILESDYRNIFNQYDHLVSLQSGSEALLKMLTDIDVEQAIHTHIKRFHTIKSEEQRKKAFALIKLLINLHVSGVKPEHMIIKKLPVIPPDLRPVVQLEGGRIATSDVNLFYRRVLMRNIRLKKMIQVGMPDVVKKNEIRLLQEAVNNLLVGEKNTLNKSGAGSKVFKSLSDMLSGKEGIFRKNLLGKRVDYSGRSVITVGPHLKLNECGLPLYIALKMFTPFIIGKLIEKKIAYTPKQAEKYIRDESPLALKILEEVIKDKYVLLNRAPTLHRLSIQAFKVKLMPGKTIRLHPLVCSAFNADFDGDQMAIHLPISDEAQREARELIASDKNLLIPASSEPTITHDQDMVMGIYYLTDDFAPQAKTAGIFNTYEKVMSLYHSGDVGVKDKITFMFNGEPIHTTVGRVLFNSLLPEKVQFINETINKKSLKMILNRIYDEYGMEETTYLADMIKERGFKYTTECATSLSMLELRVPQDKKERMKLGDEKANKVYNMFYNGFLSEEEKHRLITKLRTEIKADMEVVVKDNTFQGDDLYTMVTSGAKGSFANITQISGMKGLVMNPKGEIIELPIKGCFAEGLSPIEYFIGAHGARKGQSDKALKTAESGYLTRKLCDASQEVIIREEDCGTTDSILFTADEAMMRGTTLGKLVLGRVLAEDIQDQFGNTVLKNGDFLNKENAEIIENVSKEYIKIRSALTCKSVSGVCQKCFGMDLSTRQMVDIGSPIGIIAAQSIGEPATQLTMRTFHGGGVASKDGDMAQGIERIKQLFEIRPPKIPALVSPFDGTLSFVENGRLRYMVIVSEYEHKNYLLKDGYKASVKKGELIVKGGVYAQKGKSKLKTKEQGVVLEIHKDHIILGVTKEYTKSLTGLTPLKTQSGEKVYKGEILTTGSLDIREYKEIVGDIEAQKYIIREAQKVYGSQGIVVNDKHLELVVKQLFSKVFIEDAGDSIFVPGTHVKHEYFIKINKELEAQGKYPAKGKRLVLGLTSIAKETDSWLSSASFQETIRVMVDSSLKGSIDDLSDLKSNVIIGRLLPVGHVYRETLEKELQEKNLQVNLENAE